MQLTCARQLVGKWPHGARTLPADGRAHPSAQSCLGGHCATGPCTGSRSNPVSSPPSSPLLLLPPLPGQASFSPSACCSPLHGEPPSPGSLPGPSHQASLPGPCPHEGHLPFSPQDCRLPRPLCLVLWWGSECCEHPMHKQASTWQVSGEWRCHRENLGCQPGLFVT